MRIHVAALSQTIAMVLFFFVAESVYAITTTWSTNLNGSYTSAANWTAGVPATADTAIFNRNLNIQYNVNFPGRPILTPLTREVRQITVGTNSVSFADTVNFNQLPAALAIDATNIIGEGALLIGDTSGQNAELSTTLSSFSTSSVTIGNVNGSTGRLNVNGGTFNVTGSQSSRDELIVGNHGSGTLNISGGADVSISNGQTVIGRFSDSVGTATLSGDGSTWMNNAITVTNGSLSVEQGGSLSSGPSAIVGADPEVTVMGNGSSWTTASGISIGTEFSGRLFIRDGGQVISTGSSGVGGSIIPSGTAVGSGAVEVDGGGSSWTNDGPLTIGINEGALTISNGAQVTSGSVAFGRTTGNVVQDSTTLGLVEGSGSLWTINGDLNWGVFGINTLKVNDGGKVAVSGTMNLYNSGTIEGDGVLAGHVNNAGTISPGNSLGALRIEGSYSQLAALAGTSVGDLNIELAGITPGASYDQLLVTGNFIADGTLNVSFINGFSPEAGNDFDILDFAQLTGTFDTLNLPTLTAPLLWNTSQLYTSGTISIVSTGLPGDYNQNGTVDAADYTVWRDRLGSATSLANDDTPGVGNDDYTRWRNNFGASGAAAVSSIAVPEPNCAFSIILAVWLLFSARSLKLSAGHTNGRLNVTWFG